MLKRKNGKNLIKIVATALAVAISFAFSGCNTLSREDEVFTYSDSTNNAIWKAVYERLTEDYGCSTDYTLFRSSCSSLKGDEYDSVGDKRSGVRISKVEKAAFNDYIDMYTLTLNDEASTSLNFALVSEMSDDVTAYDVFAKYNPESKLAETDFIENMANGDLYVTLTIDVNGADYADDTEFTFVMGTTYTFQTTPTRGNDKFLGWYSGENASEEITEKTISVDYDTAVYALWESYDYNAVDYSEWDSVSTATIPYYEAYFTESFRAELSQFVADVNALRGTLTQGEIDYYSAEYTSRIEHGDYVRAADVARVYIIADGSITKDAYTDATVIVTDKEGESYSGFRDASSKIKLRGNSTAKLAKKPYNFKLSTKRAVFGMVSSKKWCLIANATDKTLMRNAIALSLAKDFGLPYASDYRIVEVFLNGVNQGCYMLVEQIDIDKQKVDIDVENGDALLQLDNELARHDEATSYFYTGSTDNSTIAYRQCFGIERYDEADVEYVQTVKARVDEIEIAFESQEEAAITSVINVESFVNYYLLCEYCKDIDATISSKWFFLKDGILYAGPPWDYDLSMGNVNYNSVYKTSGYFQNSTGSHGLYANTFVWFKSLMNCSWFKELVKNRLSELKATITSYYSGENNFIDTFCSTYAGVIGRNYASTSSGGAGWPINVVASSMEYSSPYSTYSGNVEFLRTWLTERTKWLSSYFGAV